VWSLILPLASGALPRVNLGISSLHLPIPSASASFPPFKRSVCPMDWASRPHGIRTSATTVSSSPSAAPPNQAAEPPKSRRPPDSLTLHRSPRPTCPLVSTLLLLELLLTTVELLQHKVPQPQHRTALQAPPRLPLCSQSCFPPCLQ
jgi:hypothetical protein